MTMKLTELNPRECYEFLEGARFGHLGCCSQGHPYIAAIYFSFAEGIAFSFSMPGKKLDWMRENENVCLYVEQHPHGGGWSSVVADGRFEEFPDSDRWQSQRLHAWSLLQKNNDWWEMGSMKPHDLPVLNESPHVFYGITITSVSGRTATKVD